MKQKKYMAAIAVGLSFLLAATGCGKEKDTETVKLTKGTLQTTVRETGTVVFDDSYTITPLSAGKILSADFEEGDTVTKGQVLYTVDSVDLSNSIEQAKVNLDKANEALKQSRRAAADLTVKAKASGLVTAVYVHVGDYVTPGTKIADIVENNTLKVTLPFSVPEGAISEGESAMLTLQSDGSVVYGTVEKVYESGQGFSGTTRGVNVEITLNNPGALKKGDSVVAAVGGYASLSAATLFSLTEQSVYSTQQGEVKTLSLREGARISAGTAVMTIKNDAVTNAVNNAQLSVKEIQTNIRQLQEKLSDYTLTSPIDGIVIEKKMKEGDIAQPGLALVTLADNGRLYVDAEIDELFIHEITEGQSAGVTVSDNGQMQYTGRVKRIDDAGTEENGVTYYTVRIELDDFTGLISGMSMDVCINTGEKETQYLPIGAVAGGKVRVKDGNKFVEKEVQTGIKTDLYIEVLSGIDEDMEVLAGGGSK